MARDAGIHIRPLTGGEWRLFRDFRLAALQAAPGVFTATYAVERDFPQHRWQRTVTGDDHQVFGLFDGNQLVGIAAVFTHRDDPSGRTALLAMSFIEPAYRGRGLSGLLYEVRLDWIAARGTFTRVVVSHRASNEASKRANQRYGFIEVSREPAVWPDGDAEEAVHYELRLSAGG